MTKPSAILRGIRVVNEARLLDEGGHTLDHILNRYPNEVKRFEEDGELDNDLYDALFDYYLSLGEMPYGIAKARTGDPMDWVAKRLEQELGVLESRFVAPDVDPLTIPAYRRKDNPRLGGLAQLEPSGEPPAHVRPETIPAYRRKELGKDFPVTLDQVHDTSDKISSIETLRKMAGLPPRV